MIYVKKIVLNENMSSTRSSIVGFYCGADKFMFDTLIGTESLLPFFDKLNFEEFEINLQFICMNDEFKQKVDDDGFLLLSGTFLHTDFKALKYTSLSLRAKINCPNWLKLKNDFLLLNDEQMYFNFEKINFTSTRGNNRVGMEYNVEALIDGYQIIKLLKFNSLN